MLREREVEVGALAREVLVELACDRVGAVGGAVGRLRGQAGLLQGAAGVGLGLCLVWCAALGLLRRERWAPESLSPYSYGAEYRGEPGTVQATLARSAEVWGWQPSPVGLVVPSGGEALLRHHVDAEQPVGYARLGVDAASPPRPATATAVSCPR